MRSAVPRRTGRSGHESRRGSALALAVLVILVLTVVGIAVAYFTQTEDKISGNAQLTRSALYAADAGLRAGEYLLGQASAASTSINTLITTTAGGAAVLLPGGKSAVPLYVGGRAYLNFMITDPATSRTATRYSLYLRNNDDDPGGPGRNTDSLVNLISIGQVFVPGSGGSPDTVLATKILEEQLILSSEGTGFESTYKHDQGATNASARG
jgi:hypothetical protein